MIERAYQDKRFEDPKIIMEMASGQRKVNRHAGSLVIETSIKIITDMINAVNEALQSEELSKSHVKAIY